MYLFGKSLEYYGSYGGKTLGEIGEIEEFIKVKGERDSLAEELEAYKTRVEELETNEAKFNEDLTRLRKIIADSVIASKPAEQAENKRNKTLKELILEEYKNKIGE